MAVIGQVGAGKVSTTSYAKENYAPSKYFNSVDHNSPQV